MEPPRGAWGPRTLSSAVRDSNPWPVPVRSRSAGTVLPEAQPRRGPPSRPTGLLSGLPPRLVSYTPSVPLSTLKPTHPGLPDTSLPMAHGFLSGTHRLPQCVHNLPADHIAGRLSHGRLSGYLLQNEWRRTQEPGDAPTPPAPA